jgi:hypothetical protein
VKVVVDTGICTLLPTAQAMPILHEQEGGLVLIVQILTQGDIDYAGVGLERT